MVRYLQTRGVTRVVWIDPYPVRLPSWRDLRRPHTRIHRERPANGAVTVITPRALPVEPFAVGRAVNDWLSHAALLRRLRAMTHPDTLVVGIGRPSHLAVTAIASLPAARRFYDAMDDVPAFYQGAAASAVARSEAAIAARVDVVLASAVSLQEKFANPSVPVRLVPNACDVPALPSVAATVALRMTSRMRPATAVFVGTIGAWFDWALVCRLATSMSDLTIDIIGPCHARPAQPLPPNVRLLGELPHDDAMRHAAAATIGLIPFVLNTVTASVDPLKYYEYRALGLPVLSSRFGTMAARTAVDGVWFADTPDGAGAAVRAARVSATTADLTADLTAARNAHDWSARFDACELPRLLIPGQHTA